MNNVIIQSIVTEKSSIGQTIGQYTFMVARTATKIDIKRAVKEVYGVEAEQVRISIMPSKTRLLKGKYEWAKRPQFKKAIVRIKDKQTIDPNKIGSGKAEKAAKEVKEKKEVKKKTVKKEPTNKE